MLRIVSYSFYVGSFNIVIIYTYTQKSVNDSWAKYEVMHYAYQDSLFTENKTGFPFLGREVVAEAFVENKSK